MGGGAMSPVTCLLFAAVLAPLGAVMWLVTLPMIFEHAGAAHRFLGGAVCLTGGVLIAAAAAFLMMSLRGLMIL